MLDVVIKRLMQGWFRELRESNPKEGSFNRGRAHRGIVEAGVVTIAEVVVERSECQMKRMDDKPCSERA